MAARRKGQYLTNKKRAANTGLFIFNRVTLNALKIQRIEKNKKETQ